jgi:acyl-CoA thioesterase
VTEPEPDLEAGDPTKRFPLQEHIGFEIFRGEGRAEARLARIGERHVNPNGAVHGAVLFALLDTAMGAAVVSVIEEGRICATTDLQIRYLRPVFEGSLTAEVRVVSAGRRMATLTGEVVDAEGRIVATGTSAFAVLEL